VLFASLWLSLPIKAHLKADRNYLKFNSYGCPNERSSFVNEAYRPKFTDFMRMRKKNYISEYSFSAFLNERSSFVNEADRPKFTDFMRMQKKNYNSKYSFSAFLTAQGGGASGATTKKYPALLWEITGRGLKKPSYLFGTMHVSSKLVFHLSDSFYMGIRNSEVVALELDPQLWQDQLFRFQNMQTNLRFYTQSSPGDYLNERSFQLEKYDDKLRLALSDEPTLINGLLYRTLQTRADFEEDTYLDLYIYQTGKKLGKQATGVENYFQTEQLIMEAAQDMMKDKKKKSPDLDGQSPYEIEKKTQEAYRKGDLDLLDSLQKLMEPSDAYLEKFLYRRNEIQAASIDSIIQHHSLFVGVGAAHLPGKRGVIELLRRKGYTLRPVLMPDRDANQKDDIDKIKVPVRFSAYTSDDGFFSVKLPGKLYRRTESRLTDSWQYADMSNGAYYMISRVRTHASFLGHNAEAVLRKVDSLLYENIPGKILKKTPVVRSGYKGFDITGKTRRGDMQRYNILVTPNEVLVFKMSGNNNYVEGEEAEKFFSSIGIRNEDRRNWADFTPAQGGFRIRLPGTPSQHKNNTNPDGITRWEYEASDSGTGDAFLVWKKSVQNYRFLEEDTADLALMEESFHLSDYIERSLSRRTGLYKGYPCLDASYLQKDGSFLTARYLIKGPHYYLLAARTRSKGRSFPAFFDSFEFTPYRYASFRNYTDTFMHISVTTPVVPDIDAGMRNIIERASSEEFLHSIPDYNGYWPRTKTALFQDDSTGEAIFVSMETFPKYYYPKDSTLFWTEQAGEKRILDDLVILSKKPFRFPDPASATPFVASLYRTTSPPSGYQYIFTDTNTSRRICSWMFLHDNRFFRVTCLDDSLEKGSEFINRFFTSLRPLDNRSEQQAGASIFSDKLDLFFGDFYSQDSTFSRRAKDAIANVYFGSKGVPRLLRAISGLQYNEKDYFTTKTRLINELGYIDDSVSMAAVVGGLKAIYEHTRDTSTFQNAVLKALAHLKKRPAFDLLKTLIYQDPPVFDNASDYNSLFQDLGDSLALARTLFPDLLTLASIDDYKDNVRSLLTSLVDSGYLNASGYESWFNQLYFDAKIQWKKQEGRDEQKLQKKTDDNADNGQAGEPGISDEADNPLNDFAVLLMPFYDRNVNVPHFFEKLLYSKDTALRLNAATLLIRNNRPVADTLLRSIAANDQFRSRLLKNLETIHKADRFPGAFRNQIDIARSLLVASKGNNDFFTIELFEKRPVQFRQKRGYIYLFKYKVNKDDDWQIGFSGIQPLDPREVSTDNDFVRLTNKKISADKPAAEQFDLQLKKFLFSKRRNAASFYTDNDFYDRRIDED